MNTSTNDDLVIWTIYNSPKDFPGEVVARKWLIRPSSLTYPTDVLLRGSPLEDLRQRFASMGLVCLGREQHDDPCIIESWV